MLTPFTSEQLRDQVATLLIAGHETTALALFWSLHLLASAPEVQSLVAAEADGGWEPRRRRCWRRGRSPTPSSARRCGSIRRRLDVRLALRPDEVMGREVQPGSILVVAPWILHRHRKLSVRPGHLNPGRFLPDAPPVDRYAWLPFGIGPRICIGAQFALVEATLVLLLARAFRLEPVDRRPAPARGRGHDLP